MERSVEIRRLIFRALICIAALGAGVALFISLSEKQKESRYKLSDERMFGITNLDEVVEIIRDSLKNRSKEIGISFSFHGDYMEDVSPFVKELMGLACQETGKADEGDYLRHQMGGYDFSYGHEAYSGGYRYSINITPSYYSTHEQELKTTEKVQEILRSLPVTEDSRDYDKVRAVYDYLKENVSYDIVHKKNEYHTLKSTAYGALVNRSATCQGIAVSACRLLKELGMDCRVITGMGITGQEREYHAWNIVCVDGLYYNMDVTWGLAGEEGENFLLCDENFKDHERDEEFRRSEFYIKYPMAAEDYDITKVAE